MAERNIRLFYITRALFVPFFWLPVLFFYFTSVKGLNPLETTFLLGLQEFLLIFLEIPTGIVADRFSRKTSIAIGYILTSLPFIFLPFVNSYLLFIVIFFVKAVGKALVSGADSSLLYDLLKEANRTSDYKRIMSRSKGLYMFVTAVCVFLGGFIATSNIHLTVILPFPLMIIGAVAAFMIHEPDTSGRAQKIMKSGYLVHVKESFVHLMKNPALLILVVVFSVAESVGLNLKWYATPMLTDLSFGLSLVGGIMGMLYVLRGFASWFAAKFLKDGANRRNMSLGLWGLVVCFALPALFFSPVVVIVCLSAVTVFYQVVLVVSQEEIQERLEDHNRSTVMSAVNLMSSVVTTITLNLFGFFHLHSGLWAALAVISLVCLGSVPFVTLIKQRDHARSPILT